MKSLLLALALPLGMLAQLEFKDLDGKSLALTDGGKPVWSYNYGMILAPGVPKDRTRCCYIHPLYTPGGVVVSDDFPQDHLHQRGVSWTWAVVALEGQSYDLWNMKGIYARHEKFLKREVAGGRAVLAMREGWFVGEMQVVQADVEVTVHVAADGKRDMDFAITLLPIVNGVSIGGAPDHNKGYGGFEVRLAPRTGTVINTSDLADSPDTDMVPHEWAETVGNYTGGRAAVRITVDPANAGYPNGWILRHYGLIGANYPGPKPVGLKGPLTMKYRLTVSDAGPVVKQKKVLVYTRNGKGYVHDNIAASVAAIQKMGRDNGFLVDATDDNNFITDTTLAQYDAVVFSNSNNEAFTDDRQRASFQKFIENGGGYVGIHVASGSERTWPYYWQTVGGKFNSHPKLQKFKLHVADGAHPSTKGMPTEFEWEDECYFHDFMNPSMHPLLTVDPAQLVDSERIAKGRTGEMFGHAMPLAWTLETGKSRRFYTGLGHKKEDYSNPVLYNHILGGILWTLTDRR